MKVDILSLKKLFQQDIRYVIPTFQRPYVWNQEEQWEPLWDDVRNVAEEYLDQLEIVGPDQRAQAEERTGAHFMGAVVVQQQPTPAAEIDVRHVIDGPAAPNDPPALGRCYPGGRRRSWPGSGG